MCGKIKLRVHRYLSQQYCITQQSAASRMDYRPTSRRSGLTRRTHCAAGTPQAQARGLYCRVICIIPQKCPQLYVRVLLHTCVLSQPVARLFVHFTPSESRSATPSLFFEITHISVPVSQICVQGRQKSPCDTHYSVNGTWLTGFNSRITNYQAKCFFL